MSKNVAVFVDVANIFYAAKAAGVDIDYVTLLKASSAGRDLVRAYAYTGLDPENENQRNFHDFLRRHGYKVVSKDIRKYGDGKVKANLDIELVVDMLKTARNLDIAIVVSGDGDFAPAIRAVQEMGVRVEVVSFRGNTSSDLIDVADIFTDITQVAKVEKGSSRSGRRVATDEDEDLSMTEVPEKQSEGTGDGRRRRSSRTKAAEGAAAAPRRRSSADRSRKPADEGELVVLPGEKLSRAPRTSAKADEAARAEPEAEPETEAEADGEVAGATPGVETHDGSGEGLPEEAHRRRRRRRGGRGRGRGRGREDQAADGGSPDAEPEDLEDLAPMPSQAPRRAAFSFGSVWDSQLGKPAGAGVPAAASAAADLSDDGEDLDEPAIPEYLLTERRRQDAARGRTGRGGRGVRSAYAAALDRERFGGGRGSASASRYAEPARGRDVGVSRSGRPPRSFDRSEPRSAGGEPWSEVPPEIEAMLRAQMASGGAARRGPAGAAAPQEQAGSESAESPTASATVSRRTAKGAGTGSGTTRARSRASTPRAAKATPEVATADAPQAAGAVEAAAPATRRRAAGGPKTAKPSPGAAGDATPTRSRRRAAGSAAGVAAEEPATAGAESVDAPTRRVTRRKAAATS